MRLEWGPTGGAAVAAGADVAVVVDVLSFTTTLGIAVARGTRVLPFAWKDERTAEYAAEHGAVLAVGRHEARVLENPPPSLSPAQLLEADPVPRLVLPSPNGSTICAALGTAPGAPALVGASLRTRAAVAAWLAPQVAAGATVALVPAGERWPDGSLRPALEDLWGAGAVLAALTAHVPDARLSIEAEHAAAAYALVADPLPDALDRCASGRELTAVGFAADVRAAAHLDADDVVPLLGPDGFAPAPVL
ncbi:2-phosphosulfolactate phosphatase [Nocardioides panacisoli]|uniref:Probable 2-phosphosulfolactate phosphatase n=1 Tax=Nocardioides panacisoli TaxID=627624 RepID=A0ABP7IJ64_9ACTN